MSFLKLFRYKRKTYTLIIILSLGFSGLLGVDLIKNIFFNYLNQKSNEILSGDIRFTSRSELSDEELTKIETRLKPIGKTKIVEVFTMVTSENFSKLSQIKIIDDSFPLYGKLKLKKIDENLDKEGLYMDVNLYRSLNLDSNNEVSLAGKKYIVSHLIEEDPTVGIDSFSLAPKIIIKNRYFNPDFLKEKGSLVTYRYSYLSHIKSKDNLNNLIHTSDVSIHDLKSISNRNNRLIENFSDYISLVSLTILFLSFISLFFLIQNFMYSNMTFFLSLKVLGASIFIYFKEFVIFITTISIISFSISIIISLTVLQITKPYLSKILNIPFSYNIDVILLGQSYIIFFIGLILLISPIFIKILFTKANRLFNDNLRPHFSTSDLLFYLPLLIYLYLITFLYSNSWKLTNYFFSAIIINLFVFFLILSFLLFFLKILSRNSIKIKLILHNLERPKFSGFIILSSLGICSTLICSLLIIQESIKNGFNENLSTNPSFFMFDIQEEQIRGLNIFLKNNNIEINNISPMIRARLVEINGKKIQESNEIQSNTREEQDRERFSTRSQNLSIRNELSPSEKIIAGKWFSPQINSNLDSNLFEISLEERFANRLQVTLNDVLKFEVQGVNIEGKVTSLRKVNWLSFNPNFFIIFQPKSIEDAPKSYVASINSPKNLDDVEFLRQMNNEFPNISIVDIKMTLEKVREIIKIIILALLFLIFIALIISIIIYSGIYEIKSQNYLIDLTTFKFFGADLSFLTSLIRIENYLFFFLLAFSSFGLSLLASSSLIQNLFEYSLNIPTFWILSYFLITFLIFQLYFTLTKIKLNQSMGQNRHNFK